MSDYEQYIGKAKLVPNPDGLSLEHLCKEICLSEGIELRDCHDSYEEVLSDRSFDYEIVGKEIYKIIECKELDASEDIYHAEKNPDETISFVVRFYNGGCPFSEAFADAITGMKEAA